MLQRPKLTNLQNKYAETIASNKLCLQCVLLSLLNAQLMFGHFNLIRCRVNYSYVCARNYINLEILE